MVTSTSTSTVQSPRASKPSGPNLNGAKNAPIYQDMTAQNAEQEWNWTVNRFMRQLPRQGYRLRKDESKRADLDGFVKALAQVEANANKDFDWFLAEAHKR